MSFFLIKRCALWFITKFNHRDSSELNVFHLMRLCITYGTESGKRFSGEISGKLQAGSKSQNKVSKEIRVEDKSRHRVWLTDKYSHLPLPETCLCQSSWWWVCGEGERKAAQRHAGSCTDKTRIMTLKGNDAEKSNLNGYSLNTKGRQCRPELTIVSFINRLVRMQPLQWQRAVVLTSFLY